MTSNQYNFESLSDFIKDYYRYEKVKIIMCWLTTNIPNKITVILKYDDNDRYNNIIVSIDEMRDYKINQILK